MYYNGPLEYTDNSIYGYYVRQQYLINGRSWYKNDGNSIWWNDEYDVWNLGPSTDKGSSAHVAYLDDYGSCLPKIPNNWKLYDGYNEYYAGNKLKVRCGYKPKGK